MSELGPDDGANLPAVWAAITAASYDLVVGTYGQ